MHKGNKRDEVKKLLILGMMEKRILRLSRRLILDNLAYTHEDTAQEFRIKVLSVCDRYHGSSAKDIISVCCTSILNDTRNMIKMSNRIYADAVVVDLSEAMNIHSINWIAEVYTNLAMEELQQILHPVERDILQAITCQDTNAYEFMQAYCEWVNRPIHVSMLALQKYFGYSERDIKSALSFIRNKIPQAMQYIPPLIPKSVKAL